MLSQFLAFQNDEQVDAPSTSIHQRCLMLPEGRRVIFVTFRYTPETGVLKYAASVFKKDPLFETDADGLPVYNSDGYLVLKDYWTWDEVDTAVCHQAVWLDGEEKPYYEITELDIDNHIKTTTRRWELRPVRVVVESGLSYNDILKAIRWEMCHGAGCKGVRSKSRGQKRKREDDHYPHNDDDNSSVSSYLSTSSVGSVSPETYDVKTIHHARYITDTREIFIAFKGRQSTGEILYGAAIHQKSDPDEHLSEDASAAHFDTADARLDRCPVQYRLPVEVRHYKKQLKSSALHREDLTVCLVDNIFTRRGGQIQHRGEKLAY